MQRASTFLLNSKQNQKSSPTFKSKLAVTIITAGMLSLTGCQAIKNLTDKDSEAVATAEKSDAKYYQEALVAMEKGRYLYASEQLSELRTFFPTGPYAEQALLDLMYSQFQAKEYELAATSAEQFIKLYPRNPQIDYAYYVRGVANMHSGTNALLNFAKLNQAHRDTSYYRLAFSNFQDLLSRYPTSSYAPDAAQRMTFIYNQFAESELSAARWYIKREAYVAAANRAKWVFQYYPLSQQTPEAIAILAYSNEQLGLNDLAQQYKTLLQINYPEWLTNDGKVRIDHNRRSSLLNKLTFGKLGRADNQNSANNVNRGQYTGATKQQVVYQARQLQLPANDTSNTSHSTLPTISRQRRNINIGLGLPEGDTTQPSPTQQAPSRTINSPSEMYPEQSAPVINTTEQDAAIAE